MKGLESVRVLVGLCSCKLGHWLSCAWFQDGEQEGLFTSLACFEEHTWSKSRTDFGVRNAGLAALEADGPFEPWIGQNG